MNGGELIASVLEAQGVRTLFTLVGGHISPILVGAKARGVRVVDVRHEASAVFAADATARMTGVPGVAAVTAGPGLTNTITAVQNALLAESPVIVLGGATATVLKGRGSLQDIDQLALMRPVTKWATTVRTVRGLVKALEEGFRVAQEGVPGPVFIECPVDLLYDEATIREWYAKDTPRGKDVAARAQRAYLRQHLWRQFLGSQGAKAGPRVEVIAQEPSPSEVKQVVEALRLARKPVLVIGSQTMLHADEAANIAAAVRRLGVPTFLGGSARGLLGRHDPLQLRHKRSAALREADLVIITGFPMDFRLGYGNAVNRRATLVTVNRDRAQLTKNRKPTLGVHADPGRFLQALAAAAASPNAAWAQWSLQLHDHEAARDAEIAAQALVEVPYLNPLALCQQIEAVMADDAVMVVDGGDFVATASYIVRPRAPLSWLDPGVFGTLGVGGGFALAAAACRPGTEVWLFYGDGSSAYSLAELDSFARQGLAVIAVIGTNGTWAQILREQAVVLKDDVACVLARSAYHTVALGYGAHGLLVERIEDLPAALTEAKRLAAEGKPVVINAMITDVGFREGSLSI